MAAVNWENVLIALIGALVGGGLTGFFSFKATKKAHQNILEIAEKNEKNL